MISILPLRFLELPPPPPQGRPGGGIEGGGVKPYYNTKLYIIFGVLESGDFKNNLNLHLIVPSDPLNHAPGGE